MSAQVSKSESNYWMNYNNSWLKRQEKNSFFSSLPKDARIGNKQLREAELIRDELQKNSNQTLTEKEKALLERAERYYELKEQFYQENERDEL